MDYLLYDPRTHAVWVPAGNTGSVDVVDTASLRVTRIDGFPTRTVERDGKQRVVGPSAAALGDTVVYIGNRGDSSVCAIADATLAKGACGILDASPDGIAYAATSHEVWVTTPRDHSIRVLDGTTLAQKAKIALDGQPEGFAVDATRNRFYTNLSDTNVTIAIDLATHAIVATWKPGCTDMHGVRLDEPAGFLFVACGTKVIALDAGHDGATLGSVETGDGVDDFDYDRASHTLYAGAARAARLTVATVDGKGAITRTAVVPTKDGARNGVVDGDGRVYLSHSKGSELLVVATRH
jgi:DNA-binding beta-propeller fold protein YncE